MKTLLLIIAIVVGSVLLIALGAGLSVLLAYGVGWVLTRFLPFSIFEASLLSVFGVLGVTIFLVRLIAGIVNLPSSSPDGVDEDEEDERDKEDDWVGDLEEEDDETPAQPKRTADGYVEGIPRWRQSPKQPDFSKVGRNALCPCGSGKKYKHCHGAKSSA